MSPSLGFGEELFGNPETETIAAIPEDLDSEIVLAYVTALSESLPPGPLWDVDKDIYLFNFLTGLSYEFSRDHAHLEKLTTETNPIETVELLPEWEQVFALPDACAPPALTLEARKAAVAAAFLASGGQRPADYIHLMDIVFGYDVEIVEGYKVPFTTSDGTGTDIPPWSGSVVGDALYEYADWFAWKVVVHDRPTQEIQDRIDCMLQRTRPAHTSVTVEYAMDLEF